MSKTQPQVNVVIIVDGGVVQGVYTRGGAGQIIQTVEYDDELDLSHPKAVEIEGSRAFVNTFLSDDEIGSESGDEEIVRVLRNSLLEFLADQA